MAPTPIDKILRVGVIQGGKIIEERHLKRRDNVTIGHDARNTIVIPASTLPASFTVFEFRNGQYHLCFADTMDGRVRVGQSDVDFGALRNQGLAKRRGNLSVLPLTDAAKGKISLGEVTLLFQFVSPPPEPPKPELPSSVRGSVFQSMDRLFFGILAASLAFHFSAAGCIILSPKPVEQELSLDELPDRFAKVFIPQKAPEPEKVEAKAGNEEAKKDDHKEEKKDTAAKKANPGDDAARKAAIAKRVQSKGLLKILGSSGSGGGAIGDLLGSGGAAGDIAGALAGAGGVGVATSDALGGGAKGGGSGEAASIGDLGTSGGGNVNLGSKGDAKISGHVKDSAPEVESADVDREALARYVRARLKAIQGCYEKELKRNPSLHGKVVVRFNIKPDGRAGDIDIEENSLGNEGVSSCIKAVIRGWFFPFKPSDDVPVAYPFVFSPAS